MTYVVAQPDGPFHAIVTSRHRSLDAAMKRYSKQIHALRRLFPGQTSPYLQRVILCTKQTGSRIEVIPDEILYGYGYDWRY